MAKKVKIFSKNTLGVAWKSFVGIATIGLATYLWAFIHLPYKNEAKNIEQDTTIAEITKANNKILEWQQNQQTAIISLNERDDQFMDLFKEQDKLFKKQDKTTKILIKNSNLTKREIKLFLEMLEEKENGDNSFSTPKILSDTLYVDYSMPTYFDPMFDYDDLWPNYIELIKTYYPYPYWLTATHPDTIASNYIEDIVESERKPIIDDDVTKKKGIFNIFKRKKK